MNNDSRGGDPDALEAAYNPRLQVPDFAGHLRHQASGAVLRAPGYWAIRQGERSTHDFRAAALHPLDLSAWRTLQALGTPSA